ncbi:hypothetical protein ACOMHN_054780 [Nucella lapillus]
MKYNMLASLFFLWTLFQNGEGGGKIEIHMQQFESSCVENFFFINDECDPFFVFCIDTQRAVNINQCFYKKATSDKYLNDNTFRFGSDIQGVPNPIVADADSFPTSGASDVMFVVEVHDANILTVHDYIAILSANLSYTPAASSSNASWVEAHNRSDTTHVWFAYRFYCEENYYTETCDVFCEALDNSTGHYTCINGTGEINCNTGWTGENCTMDVDECEASPCLNNGTCTNLPGSYHCACPNGFGV